MLLGLWTRVDPTNEGMGVWIPPGEKAISADFPLIVEYMEYPTYVVQCKIVNIKVS